LKIPPAKKKLSGMTVEEFEALVQTGTGADEEVTSLETQLTIAATRATPPGAR